MLSSLCVEPSLDRWNSPENAPSASKTASGILGNGARVATPPTSTRPEVLARARRSTGFARPSDNPKDESPECASFCAKVRDVNLNTWAGIAVIVTGLATVVTAVVAMFSLTGSRQDSRERTRPVLVPQLRRELLSHGTINLVLHNYGASSAHNVCVAFDPPLPDSQKLDVADMLKWIAERYAVPYPLLAPGMSLSNVYRAGQDEVRAMTMKLTYSAAGGRQYHGHFYLDPKPLMKETTANPSDSNNRELRLIKAVEAIVRSVDRP